MNPKYLVLALDLDGTLTNSKKEITPATKAALEKAAMAGVKIVLASGRPVIGMRHVAQALDLKRLDGYIVAGNGSQVFSCRTDEVIYTSAVDPSLICDIERIADDFDVAALCYDSNGIITNRPEDKYVHLEAYNNALPIAYVADLAHSVTWPAPKIMIVGEPEKIEICCNYAGEFFAGRLSVFKSEKQFMEFTALGNDKASGLEKLLAHLKLPRESLMACGDAFNDIPMLNYAHLSVAMGNAYPEAKAVARVITGSNDEDGVAQAVYKYIFGEEMPLMA